VLLGLLMTFKCQFRVSQLSYGFWPQYNIGNSYTYLLTYLLETSPGSVSQCN